MPAGRMDGPQKQAKRTTKRRQAEQDTGNVYLKISPWQEPKLTATPWPTLDSMTPDEVYFADKKIAA